MTRMQLLPSGSCACAAETSSTIGVLLSSRTCCRGCILARETLSFIYKQLSPEVSCWSCTGARETLICITCCSESLTDDRPMFSDVI